MKNYVYPKRPYQCEQKRSYNTEACNLNLSGLVNTGLYTVSSRRTLQCSDTNKWSCYVLCTMRSKHNSILLWSTILVASIKYVQHRNYKSNITLWHSSFVTNSFFGNDWTYTILLWHGWYHISRAEKIMTLFDASVWLIMIMRIQSDVPTGLRPAGQAASHQATRLLPKTPTPIRQSSHNLQPAKS
jgi:hypothetical protein